MELKIKMEVYYGYSAEVKLKRNLRMHEKYLDSSQGRFSIINLSNKG